MKRTPAPSGAAADLMLHRGQVRSHLGMVSSSHPLASLVGARVLSDGGNAVDAAVAMAAVAFVVLPGQCGPGGDVFALYHRGGSSAYQAVHGSGLPPEGGSVSFYTDRGLQAIPLDGALSVCVPGAVPALAALHRYGGSRDLSDLWAPAVTAARGGTAVTAKTVTDISTYQHCLAADADAARRFLPGGRLPKTGDVLFFPELADTMELLAVDPESIRAGELAERCLLALQGEGAPFSGKEWHQQACPVQAAISGPYRGRTIYQTALPSPGYMVLQQAALLDEELNGLPQLGTDAVHLMAQAAQIAFTDRFKFVGSDGDGWRETLRADRIGKQRLAMRTECGSGRIHARGGDTTSLVCVDREGNAVSLVQSLAFTFGARMVVPGTGILLNNRLGRGSYLLPEHPNVVAPHRKPMHTLNAWMVAEPTGELAAVGSTPGGDGQVQWNMQLISHLFDHDSSPQQAVEAPRFTVGPGSDADALQGATELVCERRLDQDVVVGLRQRGHAVREVGPWEGGGSAQLITRLAGDSYLAGCDPRMDGCALGV